MIAAEHNAPRRAGLTMVELLVSVVVLLVVMLSFGTIMRQIQRVVSTGEKTIRTNSAAAAIVEAIRSDVGRATRNGMLCITQTGANSPPLLTFTAAGVVPSKTETDPASATSANASLVAMSLCDNAGTGSPKVLYSQRLLLTGVPGGLSRAGDCLTWDLANIQGLSRSNINVLVDNFWTWFHPPSIVGGMPAIALPCRTPTQAENLWQVLADQCEWVSVTWTDGATDPAKGLLWYGVDYDADAGRYVVAAQSGTWKNDPNPANREFNVGVGAADVYRALWTHYDQNNWPRALRVRYSIIEDANTTPVERKVYEVICPVGG